MAPILLSPKVDFVFKRIFGNEEKPEILISFLNAVIKPVSPIKKVKIDNTDLQREHSSGRLSILDIKATTDTGEIINIEIQVRDEYNIDKRSLYHWAKMYTNQLKKGEPYSQLSRTICINVIDFNFIENDLYHNIYRLKNVETNEELTDIEELHFIELKKFEKQFKLNNNKKYETILEKWIDFINAPENLLGVILEEKEISEAVQALKVMSMSEDDRNAYEHRKLEILRYISELDSSWSKGIAEGIEKGKVELIETMLANADDETISKITDISIDTIAQIRKNNDKIIQ